ncbi:MAG TPA: DUF1800 domain-containing protein [Xanthomonadales bacterium]|nr:DUF1800 domain-containing protein [Xanthomonadales bacterium]
MAHSRSQTHSRRQLLGGAAAIGAAGLLTPGHSQAQSSPPKFDGLTPLWPAPSEDSSRAPVTTPPLAALVLNKAAFGPRPGDIDAFNALAGTDPDRLTAWINIQLNPTGADAEVDTRLADLLISLEPADQTAYDTIDKTAEQLWTEHARNSTYATRLRPVWQMERLMLLRATYSEWQLREVLADFWFNHFNVYGREFPTYGMMPEYDRVLRPHIFGNFRDMLNANAHTASMLYYLDNYANTWPNPNENYAREVLELHTLGAIENYFGAVDPLTVGNNAEGQRAGYTEIDVFQFARALTGWGVSDTTDSSPDTGAFMFRPLRHYNFSNGPIEVMDVSIPSTGGEADVTDILDYLAGHYGTARYIAWKLCTRLIGDNPPPGIVDSTAAEFFNRANDSDQLKEVYRHVLESAEFQTTWGDKVSRPIETLVRAMRAADVDLTIRLEHSTSNSIFGRLDDTGQYPFGYEAPTGYPDEQEMWQGTGPLIMSWRTVTFMLRQSSIVDLGLQTNTGIPAAIDRTPENVVDFWMNRALGYPLEGAVTARIVQFITDIAGIASNADLDSSPSVDTSNTGNSSLYTRIIRATVGLVLMAPDAMRR